MDENVKLKLLKGDPILLTKSNLFFFHRSLSEIVDYDYYEFLKTIQLFNLRQEDIQELLPTIHGLSVFSYFILMLQQESELSNLFRKGMEFFVGGTNVHGNAEKQLIYCDYGELENVEISQEGFNEILSYIILIYNGGDKPKEEQKLSAKEKKMKEKFEKLKRLREKTKLAEDSEEKSELSDMIGGFLVRNSSMGFREVLALPYFTFFFLLKKLKNYDDYDLQLRAMLAGAEVHNDLRHWLMNTDD